MKPSDTRSRRGLTWMDRFSLLVGVVAFSIAGITTAVADSPSPLVPTGTSVRAPADAAAAALALRWFTQMQAGRIDRSQYATAYSAQLTDGAVLEMARRLNQYGASPIGADVVGTRRIGEQTFYVVRINLPRGDATGLLLGLDAANKITGIDFVSMAGD
jgi:hypothetical protein